jgi:hypothetical protein
MAVKGDEFEEWQLDRKPGKRRIRDPIKYWIKETGPISPVLENGLRFSYNSDYISKI